VVTHYFRAGLTNMYKKAIFMQQSVIRLFLTVSIIVFALQASAQVGFGLKGGLNLSTLDIKDPEASYESKTGFHAGIFMRGRFDKIAIQPEVLLFTQNGDIKSSIFGTAQESFTYISVPVLLKFYPIAGLNVHVGPQFGFLVDGERKYDTFLGSGTEDIKEYYKKSDTSLSFGAGYDFGFGLSFDVRYNLGLKDINNAANGEEVKSRVFLISLGWNFFK
jgi:hypothetical protein